MPEEIVKPIHYVNGDLEVSGSAKIKEVENGTGSIVTYDETTKELKKRTGAQIIGDLNLAEALQTVPNTREIIAGSGLTGGGNLTENRKFDLGVGGAITNTSTNSVSEDSHTHELGKDVKDDIANRIPYTGANKAINFGTQMITHNGIKIDVNSVESPWLTATLTQTNKVIWLTIENLDNVGSERRFILEIESIGGNGQQVKLKKTVTCALLANNNLSITSESFTEVQGGVKQWTIGNIEKLSNNGIKIPLILLGNSTGTKNKITLKNTNSSVITNIAFSTLIDPGSTLTGVAPINTEDRYIGSNNEQLNLTGNKKTTGEWEFAKVKKTGKSDSEVLLAGGGDKSLADFAMSAQTYTKNQVNELLAPKLDIEDLDGFVNNVTYNPTNHQITFFKQNSPNILVDLPIESLIKNVVLSGNNLVFTFENNTTVSVPLNTLLVGVVKEVNGKVPNSQGVITLEISDIPSLSSALDGKSNIRLSNVASDLNATEKSAIRNKVGAGTVNSVSISLPDGFAVGTATITDSGTFNISFSQGYSLPTTAKQNAWDNIVEEAVTLSGNQEISGAKRCLGFWIFDKPVQVADGTEDTHAVSIKQLKAKAEKNLSNLPSNLTTQETNIIKQKLKIDNFQNTGNTYPLEISSEFTDILATIPEVTVENAIAYIRNRNLIVSITLKNAAIANTDVISSNSIVKLFSLTPEISDILQGEITAIVPHVKLTSTDVYSTATNKMFLDFEDKSIKQPFRLTLRSSSTTTFYAEFECLDM